MNISLETLKDILTADQLKELQRKSSEVKSLDDITTKTLFWENVDLIERSTKKELVECIKRLTTKPVRDYSINPTWEDGVVFPNTEVRRGQAWQDWKTIFQSFNMKHEGSVKKGTFKWTMAKADFDKALKAYNEFLKTGEITLKR